MNETFMIAYFVGSAVALVILIITNLWTRGDLEQLKDLNQRLRDKWAQTEALCRKLEAVALWYVDHKNMAIENTGSWITPWIVVAKKDPNAAAKLADIWAEAYMHREELAEAIFDANLKALRTFSHEQQHEEKTRKEIYEEKKALRRKK